MRNNLISILLLFTLVLLNSCTMTLDLNKFNKFSTDTKEKHSKSQEKDDLKVEVNWQFPQKLAYVNAQDVNGQLQLEEFNEGLKEYEKRLQFQVNIGVKKGVSDEIQKFKEITNDLIPSLEFEIQDRLRIIDGSDTLICQYAQRAGLGGVSGYHSWDIIFDKCVRELKESKILVQFSLSDLLSNGENMNFEFKVKELKTLQKVKLDL